MGKTTRGRKKGSKNKLKGRPENYDFWCGILKSDQVGEFIKRGDKRQKNLIKHTLQYMKKENPETFEYLKGERIADFEKLSDKRGRRKPGSIKKMR